MNIFYIIGVVVVVIVVAGYLGVHLETLFAQGVRVYETRLERSCSSVQQCGGGVSAKLKSLLLRSRCLPDAWRRTPKWPASRNGDDLCGHLTASGERFDCSAMTAAHRSLPFGSGSTSVTMDA